MAKGRHSKDREFRIIYIRRSRQIDTEGIWESKMVATDMDAGARYLSCTVCVPRTSGCLWKESSIKAKNTNQLSSERGALRIRILRTPPRLHAKGRRWKNHTQSTNVMLNNACLTPSILKWGIKDHQLEHVRVQRKQEQAWHHGNSQPLSGYPWF